VRGRLPSAIGFALEAAIGFTIGARGINRNRHPLIEGAGKVGAAAVPPALASLLPPCLFAFQTAGDVVDGFRLFGFDIADLQRGTLIYLGLSSLAFVVVWVVGYLRRG
jgi:hypothetical protein